MADWITAIVEQLGYAGVFLLMLAENVFPPIPSEVVMPLAGFASASGQLSLGGVIAAGVLGSLAGAAFWFWVGARFGLDRLRAAASRHGRWLTITPSDVDRAVRWFERHGRKAVLFGRLVPAVRTLISVPAGVLGMGHRRFALYTTLGTAAWTGVLAWLGHRLGARYEDVSHWLGPVSNAVLAVLVIGYLWRVATFPRRVHGERATEAARSAAGSAESRAK
jgi:membrane protein DedA with SNARE-associated domain